MTHTSAVDSLEQCPFCGWAAKPFEYEDFNKPATYHNIVCTNVDCPADELVISDETPEAAAAKWNRRALSHPPGGSERLRDVGCMRAQADAWMAVTEVLNEVAPDWINGNEVGRDCACNAIRRLASPQGAERDDRLTLTDVAGTLAELAEQYDGGEHTVTDRDRRVLIDFVHGLVDEPLFQAVVGHYFAQNPPPGAQGAEQRQEEYPAPDGYVFSLSQRNSAVGQYHPEPAATQGDAALPERDPAKSNAEQGLYRKFDVRRTDGSDAPGGKHDGCEYFVLDVRHDPLAMPALAAYAEAAKVSHPDLARDLIERYDLSSPPGVQAAQVSDAPIGNPLVVGMRDPIECTDADLAATLRELAATRQPSPASLPDKWRSQAAECGPYHIAASTYEQCAADLAAAIAQPGSAAHGGEVSDAD